MATGATRLADAHEVDLGCERHGGQASKIRFNIIR